MQAELTPPARLQGDLALIEAMESQVRVYCRSAPVVFKEARGSEMFDEAGRRYIDFLSAAGSLNYGHNDPVLKQALVDYLSSDGIVQTLDFATTAKARFLRRFREVVLQPRGLDYKVQFTGPTGANAVEAAIKLARKCTGRRPIAAFTNAYHGVSLGALALTGNASKRRAAGVSLPDVLRLPYEGYLGPDVDTVAYARTLFQDPSSGYDLPAAFIVELVQGEGGLQVASPRWVRALAALARELGALLIVDDIQAGCGRTGQFFSFDSAELVPDIVCLSKSISGTGLPMAIDLIRPGLDAWEPGEHNGTFRGNNLAFEGATVALSYWADRSFERGIQMRAATLREYLERAVRTLPPDTAKVVGRGMILGLRFRVPELAEAMRAGLLRRGVIAETCGARDEVLKLLPALNIPPAVLAEGLEKLLAVAQELAALPLEASPA
jgi:diaminobutyrate-2-oxoglutarate transaminase